MKKLTILSIALFGGLLAGCAATGAIISSNNNSNPNLIQGSKALAYEATSAVSILSGFNNSSLKLNKRALESSNTSTSEVTQTEEEKLIETIKGYLPTIEAALAQDSLLNTTVEVSDRPEYEYVMTVSYVDLAGETHTYTMYYTEVVDGQKPVTPENPSTSETPSTQTSYRYDDDDDDRDDHDDDRDDHDDDDDDRFEHDKDHDYIDDEVSSTITGVVIYEDVEYELKGRKEVEDDEQEFKFSFHLDEGTYIKVDQEIENDEQEFEYEIYQDHKKVYEYSLEVEKENNKSEIELKEKSLEGKVEVSFDFYNRGDKTYIRAKYKVSGQSTKVIHFEKVINPDTNEVTYQVVNFA